MAAIDTRRRPLAVTVLVAVLGFLGVTALGGGIEMVLFAGGNDYLPLDMIDGVPVVDSFLLPGLVLGGVFGIGSLVGAYGVARRPVLARAAWLERRTGRHWSWTLTVALGVGFAAWMALEWAWLGTPWAADATAAEQLTTWVLYGIYDTVALLLLVLPHVASVRAHLARVVRPGADPAPRRDGGAPATPVGVGR